MVKVWRWAALAVAAIPSIAAAGDGAGKTLISAHDGAMDLGVSFGAAQAQGPGAKAQTSVNLQIANIDTRLTGDISGGTDEQDPTTPSAWQNRSVAVDSNWQGPGGVKLHVKAANSFHDAVSNGPLMEIQGIDAMNTMTEENSAGADAAYSPLEHLNVHFGAETAEANSEQRIRGLSSASEQAMDMLTDTRRVYANAAWTPFPFATLEAGAKDETIDAQWKAGTRMDGRYHYVEPRVAATVKPWSGGQMTLSSERAVAPLNTGNFAALATVAGGESGLMVAPDSEWRWQLRFGQTYRGINLSASAMAARIESATELVPVGYGAQAPASLTGGSRQQFALNLSFPLGVLGLPNTKVESSAVWRHSQITDPVTHAERRTSGEIPREAQLKVVQTNESLDIQWGFTGHLQTEQTIYQASMTDTLKTGDGMGAFVQYSPGRYALTLNVDGLVGGTRSQRDTTFADTRASGIVTDIGKHSDAAPLVSFSVSRKF